MQMVFRYKEDFVDLKKVKNTGNVNVIELGKGNIDSYRNIVGIVNEIHDRLEKAKLDAVLLGYIKSITESLNNLGHFQVEVYQREDEKIVRELMQKFETFKYKELKSQDRKRDVKIFRTKSLSETEAKEVLKQEKETRYFTAKDNEEGHFRLINCDTTPRVIAVIENGKNETILKELIEVYQRVCKTKTSGKYIKAYPYITVDAQGFHSDVMVLINNLFSTLIYIFNSYSFEKGKCYPFDAMEIGRRLDFNMNDYLLRCRSLALYQMGEG